MGFEFTQDIWVLVVNGNTFNKYILGALEPTPSVLSIFPKNGLLEIVCLYNNITPFKHRERETASQKSL